MRDWRSAGICLLALGYLAFCCGCGDTPVATDITWGVPAAIGYGTALSATQLNATANAAGTFAYSPQAGTVLSVGTHTLTVTFTPANPGSYTRRLPASLCRSIAPAGQ